MAYDRIEIQLAIHRMQRAGWGLPRFNGGDGWQLYDLADGPDQVELSDSAEIRWRKDDEAVTAVIVFGNGKGETFADAAGSVTALGAVTDLIWPL